MSARQAVNAERDLLQRLRDRGLNNNNNIAGGRGGRRVEIPFAIPIPPGDGDPPAVDVDLDLIINLVGVAANNYNNNMAGREERAPRDGTAARNAYPPTGGPAAAKRKAPSYGKDSVEAWAATEMEQETFAFLWTLKGYSSFTGTCGSEEVKSPVFRGGAKSQHHWQLKMSPKKKVEEVEYFAVHLILNGFGDGDNSNTRKLKVRFQISLLDSDGRPGKQAGSAAMNVCDFKRCSVWGYDKFITTADLALPTRRLIDQDTLKIHCRVWIEGEVKHKTGLGGVTCDVEDRPAIQRKKLADELGLIFRSAEFADVALTTKTKSFMAHKAILSARSKVFGAMFSTNMLEASMNTVEIKEFDDETIEGMLEFMYTGEVEGTFNTEKALDLLQIAEKYDLAGLKEECEHILVETLSVESAADVLLIAHLHNALHLKQKAMSYITENKEAVKKTKAFEAMKKNNAAVFVELYLWNGNGSA